MKGNGKAEGRFIRLPDSVEIELVEGKPLVGAFNADNGECIFVLTPEQASQMGEVLARKAHELHYGKKPDSRTSELALQIKAKAIDEIRPRIITRQTTMLNAFLKKTPKPTVTWMAERLVDAVLKEVT